MTAGFDRKSDLHALIGGGSVRACVRSLRLLRFEPFPRARARGGANFGNFGHLDTARQSHR